MTMSYPVFKKSGIARGANAHLRHVQKIIELDDYAFAIVKLREAIENQTKRISQMSMEDKSEQEIEKIYEMKGELYHLMEMFANHVELNMDKSCPQNCCVYE